MAPGRLMAGRLSRAFRCRVLNRSRHQTRMKRGLLRRFCGIAHSLLGSGNNAAGKNAGRRSEGDRPAELTGSSSCISRDGVLCALLLPNRLQPFEVCMLPRRQRFHCAEVST